MKQHASIQLLKTGVVYFLLVFGSGFVFGTIRTLWLVPRVGARTAELLEALCMLIVILAAARWVMHQCPDPPLRAIQRLGIGSIALVLMLTAEFSLVQVVRGMTIREYLVSRDPVAAAVYYGLLGVYAIMPLLIAPRSN